jgi:RimJ/RimL family protein N-acetyltransferase
MILRTTRLVVRRLESTDAVSLHRVCGDPAVMRFVGEGRPLSLERCCDWIAEATGHHARFGYGAAAVFVNGDDELAGYAGIVPARRRHDRELIYAFRPKWWGRGLATELVPALVDYGFTALSLPRLVALVHPDNKASIRVLEQAGLQSAGEELAAEGVTMLIYLIER